MSKSITVGQAPFYRTGFNYDPDAVSAETGLRCPTLEELEDAPPEIRAQECVTRQEFKEDADINTIVKRFGLSGEMPANPRMPLSGDFVAVSDFKTAMDLLTRSQEEFMSFPADVRARFQNDPGEMMAFLEDEANREEAVKLGLIAKPPEKTRDVVQAVDELAAKLEPKG